MSTPAAPSRTGPVRLRDGFLHCLKVFIGVRVALAVIALIGVALLPDFSHVDAAIRSKIPLVPGPVGVPGWPAASITPGWHNLFTAWERLDALWFLRIATKGYATTDASAAFFPLYPLLIRAVSILIGGHPFAASLLVSNGAFLFALVVLHALTRDELSREVADRAVVYAAFFPTALFFLAPYSESLFLLLVLLSFRWARHRRWALAGMAGALAALTRNLGVLMVLPLAVEAIHQRVEAGRAEGGGGRFRVPVRTMLWAGLPVAGTALYLGFWQAFGGDWLAPLHQQANWQRHLTNPVVTVARGTRIAFRYVGFYPGGYHLLDWVIAAAVLALGVIAAVRLRPSYGVYTWASIVIPLASIFEARPLIAFSRYALPIFPLYWAMAMWTARSRVRHEVVLGTSAALLGLMTLLFVNWYYVI